jgi:cephalosporin-C deacetylase-like acetyl esterase
MFPRIVLVAFALCSVLSVAADKAFVLNVENGEMPGDEMIERYLKKEAERLSKRFLDGAKTLKEWEDRKPRLHQEYLDMLGLWPLPEKTPLQAKVTGTVERDNIVIEKLHYQSRPGLYVTANLYRPKGVKGKLPAILYVCGHTNKGRDGNKTAFQDHGTWFASNGYVCLTVDSLQLGEVAGKHHGTYNLGRWWWQSAGYTPAGVECWNGIRGIDYLISRAEVDPECIGVTGISGGGAATIWIAAADERVKCAVAVSGMSDLESYVTNKVINGHCDCMFLVNTYGWEWTTILAQVAPRPVLFANSDNDKIFPMDGNRRIIARLRQLYKMYDKPDLVDDYVSKGGHDYRPDLRVAVFKWLNKHLKNDTGEVKDADFKPLPGKDLRVFPEDKDIPEGALNDKIDETFVKRAEVKLPEAGKFDEWKKGLLKELQMKSLRKLVSGIPKPDDNLRLLKSSDGEAFAHATTEPDISISFVYATAGKEDPRTGTLIVLNAEEKIPVNSEKKPRFDVPAWAKPFAGEGRVYMTPTRGGDQGTWTKKSPPNYVERAHALLGQTVDEGRLWDILAVQQSLAALDKEKRDWRVIGRGQAGVLAAYAALFEPSIKEVIIIDPPVSHRDGPYFLNVLRVLDIPDALGMLAPRPLTLVNAKDKAFDRTAELYKLAGAADRFQRK